VEYVGTLHAPLVASPLFFFGIVSVRCSRYFFLRFAGLICGAVWRCWRGRDGDAVLLTRRDREVKLLDI
jgi:hypothetical protein